MKRKRRVRLHLVADAHPAAELPTIEGLLIGRGRYFRLRAVSLLLAPGGRPAPLESQETVIPRQQVAFYEVIG